LFFFNCSQSGHVLVHNCSGKVGKLVSHWPVQRST
jgi:hypothetical protein